MCALKSSILLQTRDTNQHIKPNLNFLLHYVNVVKLKFGRAVIRKIMFTLTLFLPKGLVLCAAEPIQCRRGVKSRGENDIFPHIRRTLKELKVRHDKSEQRANCLSLLKIVSRQKSVEECRRVNPGNPQSKHNPDSFWNIIVS